VEKYIKILNTILVLLESLYNIFSYYINLILYMLIFFATYLVKHYKVWLWLNRERRVNKNGGSTKYISLETSVGVLSNGIIFVLYLPKWRPSDTLMTYTPGRRE
jgi:hypothetical protein